jgi:hypothetical protein
LNGSPRPRSHVSEWKKRGKTGDAGEATRTGTEPPKKARHRCGEKRTQQALEIPLGQVGAQNIRISPNAGLTLETIVDFGVGFCAKGMMADGLPFRFKTRKARLSPTQAVSPANRPTKDTPKYKLPQGFRKSQELFNIDRAIKEPADSDRSSSLKASSVA